MASFRATEIADILKYEDKQVMASLSNQRGSKYKPVLLVGRKRKSFFINLYVPSLDVVVQNLYKVGSSDADITQIAYVFKALAGDANMKEMEDSPLA